MTHTKEPWEQGRTRLTGLTKTWTTEQWAANESRERALVFGAGSPVAQCHSEHDARRIAACVNACKGLDTDELDNLPRGSGSLALGLLEWRDKAHSLEKQSAFLLEAFEKLATVARGCERLASNYSGCIDGIDESGGDDHEDPTSAIFHRLYYAMLDADTAIKQAKAVKHD